MQSNISESNTEIQVPPKKIKLSTSGAECINHKSGVLSKILLKEVRQEIDSRKKDLELIEENIFLTSQKLIHLKQAIAADYYQQKSVKGFLQYPPHPAVKDTFVGKSPVGVHNQKIFTSNVNVEIKLEEDKNVKERSNENDKKLTSVLNGDKLPCYIAPKIPDENFIKPFEPRDVHSKKEIRIVVGNVSKWLSPTELCDATHKWTVYAKIAEPDLDISLFVTKVVFFLHRSYRPNDVIEIKSPPFKLTRRGWGEFPLKTKFHFQNPADPPIDVMHFLKLDHLHTGFETFGAETSLTVWVHYPLVLNSVCDKKIPPKSDIIENEIKTGIDLLDESKIDELEINQHFLSVPKLKLDNYLDKFDEEFSIGSDIDCLMETENNATVSSEIEVEHLHDFEWEKSNLTDEIKFEKDFTSLNKDLFNGNKALINEEVEKNYDINQANKNQFSFGLYSLECGEDELLTDECAVVGEEVVIDFDESNDKVEIDNKGKNCSLANYELFRSDDSTDSKELKESLFLKTSLNNAVMGRNIDSTEVNSSLKEANVGGSSNLRTLKDVVKIEKLTNNDEENLDELVIHSKDFANSSNKIVNGLTLSPNTNRRVKKNLEKKSMIITLQKDDGQIILRKEAKVFKCKDNNLNSNKNCVATAKESGLNITPSILKPNLAIKKNNKLVMCTKPVISVKQPTIDNHKTNQELLGLNVVKSTNIGWKQSGKSLLKRGKDNNLQSATEDVSKRLSLVHNTEIAVNWLVKKFPLVDGRSLDASFRIKHPYCAKSREDFLNWPLAKQRAAEWMRAKKIGRIINNIPHLENWSTLEILDWARVRCYTPVKSIPDYTGPTLEPTLHFVYKPRINGLSEFLNKQKLLAEEEIIDVTTLSDRVNKNIFSGNTGLNVTPQFSSTENCIALSLDPEFEGYKSFIARCMRNSVGEIPLSERILPDTVYPAVERILISLFNSLAEDLIRRMYNASWIRHCDNPPVEISVTDVQAAILSRKEFDFLLPHKDDKGKQQTSVISLFRK